MKHSFKLILFLSILIFTACTRTEPTILPANHLIDGKYINIHSPNSSGWSKMKHTNSEVIFAKKGKKYNESYIARVVFFPLESTKNKNHFLKLIKRQASKSTNEKRFIQLKSNFKLSTQRNYHCVIAKQLFRDTMATTANGNKEDLFLQVKSAYCRDPKRKEAGFMIGYSFRGESIHSNFDFEANSFIDGVRFSKYN